MDDLPLPQEIDDGIEVRDQSGVVESPDVDRASSRSRTGTGASWATARATHGSGRYRPPAAPPSHGGASPARVVSRRRPPTTVAAGGPCHPGGRPGYTPRRPAIAGTCVRTGGRTPRSSPPSRTRSPAGRWTRRGGQRGRIVSLVLGPEALRDVEGRWLGSAVIGRACATGRRPRSPTPRPAARRERARFAGEAGDLADRAPPTACSGACTISTASPRTVHSSGVTSPPTKPSPMPRTALTITSSRSPVMGFGGERHTGGVSVDESLDQHRHRSTRARPRAARRCRLVGCGPSPGISRSPPRPGRRREPR